MGSSAARSAGADEKLQALQTKLSESEETVNNLKSELDTVNEKLSQLSVSEEKSADNGVDTDAIRAEHAAELEKLTSSHAEAVQALQTQLDNAETQRKELEDQFQKDLEEAKQSAAASGNDTAAAALEELKETHKAQLETLEKELADNEVLDPETPEEMFNFLQSRRGLFRRGSLLSRAKARLQRNGSADEQPGRPG